MSHNKEVCAFLTHESQCTKVQGIAPIHVELSVGDDGRPEFFCVVHRDPESQAACSHFESKFPEKAAELKKRKAKAKCKLTEKIITQLVPAIQSEPQLVDEKLKETA